MNAHNGFIKRLLVVIALGLISAGLGYFPRSVFFPSNSKKSPEVSRVATSTATMVADTADILVKRVIDGDTIELDDGKRARYIGIDTPELVHPKKPVECFAQEAKALNQRLVEGKPVRLVKDVSDTDKYGRLLRYVYVGDTFVNDYLIRQGFAFASTYPPDVRYAEQFVAAQKEARDNNRGLWAGCSVDTRK